MAAAGGRGEDRHQAQRLLGHVACCQVIMVMIAIVVTCCLLAGGGGDDCHCCNTCCQLADKDVDDYYDDNCTQCLWLVLRQPQVDLLLAGQDSKGPGGAEGCFCANHIHGCWAGK